MRAAPERNRSYRQTKVFYRVLEGEVNKTLDAVVGQFANAFLDLVTPPE
jgi:hypothetical protein